jgi:predicted DNA-binding transcriptional regulator AlpA
VRLIPHSARARDNAGMSTSATAIDHPRPLATARPWVICGISRGQWYRLAASGKTPLPVRLGTRRPVYLIGELEDWLRAGAPDRQTWQRMRQATGARPSGRG